MRHSGIRAAALLALASGAEAQEAVLLTDVNVVDVAAGVIAEGHSILIEDGVIVAVGLDLASASAERLDGDGAYVIPGLWDSHVHIFSSPTEPETALQLYLLSGVTGIRDMGALWPIGEQQELQKRIENGEVLGPRIVARAGVGRIASEGWAAVKS